MTAIPTVVISRSAAVDAYARSSRSAPTETTNSFGTAVTQAIDQAIQTGHTADEQATKAINGEGNLTQVVAALSHAEMTLQTATAIRDRVVQAYQDIMKMPI